MNYTEKLEGIKTVKELYQFRDELLKTLEQNSAVASENKVDWTRIEICQNANFFKSRVEARIEHLESKGLFLDGIALPQTPKSDTSINDNLEINPKP